MDVFTVTVRRLARRRSPMAADRDHIHHMLLRRGFGPWQTLGILLGANLLLADHWHRDVASRAWPIAGSSGRTCWSARSTSALFFMPFRLYRLRARAAAAEDYERDP